MEDKNYQLARDSAVKELEKLLAQQQVTEQRIAQLRQIIASLDVLLPTSKPSSELPRLTQAVRSIFTAANSNDALTARDVRKKLTDMGFDSSRHSNFLASIHVVLHRLEKKDEIRAGEAKGTFRRMSDDWWEKL